MGVKEDYLKYGVKSLDKLVKDRYSLKIIKRDYKAFLGNAEKVLNEALNSIKEEELWKDVDQSCCYVYNSSPNYVCGDLCLDITFRIALKGISFYVRLYNKCE